MMPKGAFPHCERCGSRVQQWTVRVCARCRLADQQKEVKP
ncbi:hypothetical protein PP499_gp62 [Gordonia phage Bjanes7]|uniref:Uncharacterized protein n=7 Tax=Caudoviricetes TaxID=2731619 RepID=A0A2H4PEV1_9CAUD|nr:hypothetical protein PP487_gp71 [Gordonia phage Herod]YP_010653851.1 hypothetical protein PP499_gp62 [Gordonia phage Bjanes7]AOE43940.1 hypothetical protein SEA_BATSTARR_70 [Gordonia phage BatStarr]AZS12806.1 hypothetical protein SEA_SPROUTIE_65 [Gordonia phage Sproutie]AZS12879.1 hypothetical protein SEA_SAVAGE_65 [Gordonia phage Savage]QGJ96687.1 hypothetical protein SEA_CYNTHIA_65 [Gordonia phage Cynthia]QPL13630.1 hypothetical protein SEA_MOCHA12_65 [Gordonia phage Mocha12]